MTDERARRAEEGLRFVCEFEVSDIERFKALVAQCVEVSRGEPGTLVYDWYLDERRGVAHLYEAYSSVEALSAHASGPVFKDIGPKLLEVCRFVKIDAYGDLPRGPSFAPTTRWGTAFARLAGSSD